MPKIVTQYNLLISCPSDIREDEEIAWIRNAVDCFNKTNNSGIHINIVYWKYNAYAESGDRAQELLNRQLVNDCDAGVAIFWSKFGTPTGEYGSGTVEEIMMLLSGGKQVFTFFCNKPYPPDVNKDELNKIREFKQWYQDKGKGIYKEYSSNEEFQQIIYYNIAQYFGKQNQSTAMMPSFYQLVSKRPSVRTVFEGRDDVLNQIHYFFEEGNRVLFLRGIGGIGKSELAKQYAKRFATNFDHVIFVTYKSSLEKLFCEQTAIIIKNLNPLQDEGDRAFFKRKLKILQALANERTLLILDNFDTDFDPDLEEFLNASYRVIITTRNAHPAYPTITIRPIGIPEALRSIFEQNYRLDEADNPHILDEDWVIIERIFAEVEYHTYAIELIAKQMRASRLSAQNILDSLTAGQFRTKITEPIQGTETEKTAFEHIRALFNISQLDAEEQKLMMYLSLMGTQGISASRFIEWSGLNSYETLNRLLQRSWIRSDQDERFSLHPLVKEVVQDMTVPTTINCRQFLWNIAAFCDTAWLRPYPENVEVTESILSLLAYFSTLMDGTFSDLFIPCVTILWQVGRFDDAINYCHILYDACQDKYGKNSIITGNVALSLAGAYFNSGKRKPSIKWYKQALQSMLNDCSDDRKEIALAYEKVARCYTWEYEETQNIDLLIKAKEHFLESLTMCMRLKNALTQGQKIPTLLNFVPYTPTNVETALGELSLELGRMYQKSGNYQKALQHAAMYELNLKKNNPEDISGIAYSYFDQGVCYYYLGLQKEQQRNKLGAFSDWKNAESMLLAALKINRSMRGYLALDTIENIKYLAEVYVVMGDKRSIEYYAEASEMAEQLLGNNHTQFLEIMQRLQEVKKLMQEFTSSKV